LAPLRSHSLFIIDLLHDTQEKHFILETAIALPSANPSAHLLNAHAAKGRGKLPQLFCQSSNCIGAKAIGKFSKPLKLYLGLQQYIFLLSIFCVF